MELRDLTNCDEDQKLLACFYDDLYEAQFPDYNERESLENMRLYLGKKSEGWYGLNNYHILLGYEDGELAAACVSDYLEIPNAGVIEFLLVGPGFRERGLGKKMLEEMMRMFHADAARAGKKEASYVIAEMNDPFLTDPANDNLDPVARAMIWGKWGFSAMDFPYVQPRLDRDKEVVRNLLLMAKTSPGVAKDAIPSETVRRMVHEYMRWAMRFNDPKENEQYQGMAEFLGGRPEVDLIPLLDYVGEAPGRSLVLCDVRNATDLEEVLPIYRSNFSAKADLAIDEEEFLKLVSAKARIDFQYHFCGICGVDNAKVEGMASYFALPWGGFGGYLALDGSLRGRGLLRALMAKIERQMLRDYPRGAGWFIECAPGGVENKIFHKTGFRRLALDYKQPDLMAREGQTGLENCESLNLWYKPFGRVYGCPTMTGEQLLEAAADIFRAVYGLEEPSRTPAFRHLAEIVHALGERPLPWDP